MFKSNLVKAAHKMVKEIRAKYPEVNYKLQFGLCLSYLYKESVNMVAITVGSEKQIAWATQIREHNLKTLQDEADNFKERSVRENWDYSTIISKIENAIAEIQVTEKTAKFWIENRNLAGAYLYKIKNQK